MFKSSWIFEPKFRWFLNQFLDSKRKHRFRKNSAPACTGAQFLRLQAGALFLRFRGIWNQQKINKKLMQNKNKNDTCLHQLTFKNMKNRKNYVEKRQLKQVAFLMRILMIFASILALKILSKMLSKSWAHSTCFRHFSQDTSKMPPRCPKTPRRPSKKPPRRL